MVQSQTRRCTRNGIAAWLNDRFGDPENMPDARWWKDADDLIKFLRADGIRLGMDGYD